MAALVPPEGRLRWLLAGALLGAALTLAYVFGFPGPKEGGAEELPSQDAQTPQPRQGYPAPDFSLMTVDGNRESLRAHRGEVVLVNFWATWCAPCRIEMPALEDRYQRYREQGFTVLAVNFDEPVTLVEPYGRELGLSFPLLLDPGGEVQALYAVRGYPSSFVVDRDGIIRTVHIGLMTEGQLDQYLGEVGVGR